MRDEIIPKKRPPISKEDFERVKAEYFANKEEEAKAQKPFKKFFNFSRKQAMNKSAKKPDLILVFLLNLKKQIEGPILTKIYGGNFLVIRNHVYRFNPDRVFSFSKYKAVIAKEYDRELVGVDDYQELLVKDFTSNNPGARINIDDPVLIKALIQARLGEKPAVTGNKWIIIVLAIIGLAVGAFLIFGGGGKKAETPAPTVTPPTTP